MSLISDTEKFRETSVLVVGDVMLDHYVHGYVERISPEAPVPILVEDHHTYALGGGANIAHNAASLGAQVTLLGAVGQDDRAETIRDLCVMSGVKPVFLPVYEKTEEKFRLLAEGQQLLRLDTAPQSGKGLREILAKMVVEHLKDLGTFDVLIIGDYAKGLISKEVSDLLHTMNTPCVADTKPVNMNLFGWVDLLTPNLKEAAEFLGFNYREEQASVCASKLSEALGPNVLVTNAHQGMYLSGAWNYQIPPFSVECKDPTGAGDVVTAAMGVSIGAGLDLSTGALIANRAAALSVTKLGTYAVSLAELRESLEHSPITSAILNGRKKDK